MRISRSWLAARDGARGVGGVTLPYHVTRQSLADMTGTTVVTTIRIVSRRHIGDAAASR
jgi:CRP-like cAMP-binding protein